MDLAPLRDGPVSQRSADVSDPGAMSAEIKRRARMLGADDVGVAALKPSFIEMGVDLPHDNVIAVIIYEDYAKALESPPQSRSRRWRSTPDAPRSRQSLHATFARNWATRLSPITMARTIAASVLDGTKNPTHDEAQ